MTDRAARVAIVTGAASGIGAATASLLSDRGLTVVWVDAVDPGDVGTRSLVVSGDVSDPHTADAAVAAAAAVGPVELLVNCAAVRPLAGVAGTDLKSWRRTLDVNLTGPFLFCQAVLPGMLDLGTGSVVNVGSLAGEGRPNMVAYAASKGGLAAFTKAMALDVAQYGIRVNLVVPGITAEAGSSEPSMAARARVSSVRGRSNTPAEVADVVAWLGLSALNVSGAVVEVGTLPRYPQEPVAIDPDARPVDPHDLLPNTP